MLIIQSECPVGKMMPCKHTIGKSGEVAFELESDIVDCLVRPYLGHGALLKLLNLNCETLLHVLRAAVFATDASHQKIRQVRLKLEKEYAFLCGDERLAGNMLVNHEKEKEGEKIGIGLQLRGAIRSIQAQTTSYAISQFVFMEAVTPAVRAFRRDRVYLRWIDCVEDVVKNPGLYVSSSQLAMEYCFWDIETTGLLPNGRMTCCVTQHGDDVRTWASKKSDGSYELSTEETANELVDYLWTFSEGKRVVTFNGASFDFRVLLEHLKDDVMRERCTTMAKNHFDLHLACIESGGHRMALNGLVLGTLGNQSKSGSGLDAIDWWNGKEYEKLFEYCQQDVLLLKLLWCHAADNGMLFYLPKRANSSRKAVEIEDMDKSAHDFSPSTFADY